MTVGPQDASDYTEEDMLVDVIDPADLDADEIQVADDDTD